MIDDDTYRRMEESAECPPLIVQRVARYKQQTLHGQHPELIAEGIADKRSPIWNLDGVPWHEAEPPPSGHKHWPQTVGARHVFDEIWRCPCGAIRDVYRHGEGWVLLDKPPVSDGYLTGVPWWKRWLHYLGWWP